MNQREWKYLRNNHIELLNFTYYNNTREIQTSLKYNSDPNAKVIHHLRDTEEQRKYNDEHYELWGHNLDGTFEYGKYVIFVTKEEHTNIHSASEETRKKRSESLRRNPPMRGKHHTQESKIKISISAKNRAPVSDDTKNKISVACSGEKNGMYGKHHSDEAKEKIGLSSSNRIPSKETRDKMSISHKAYYQFLRDNNMKTQHKGGKDHWNYGNHLSEETKKKISNSSKGKIISEEQREKLRSVSKEMYRKYSLYKSHGGNITYREFIHLRLHKESDESLIADHIKKHADKAEKK